jgi:hypothetical protein
MQDAKSEFVGRIGKIRAPIYLAQRMHLLNEAECLLLERPDLLVAYVPVTTQQVDRRGYERPDIVGFKGCWLAIGLFSCNCRCR